MTGDCIFVEEWECGVDSDEIPLEVCRTCVKARSVASRYTINKKNP